MPQDVGRPIAHIRHAMDGVDLVEHRPRRVFESSEEPHRDADRAAWMDGRHLLMRAIPYREISTTRCRGIVMNFIDISEIQRARGSPSTESEERFTADRREHQTRCCGAAVADGHRVRYVNNAYQRIWQRDSAGA